MRILRSIALAITMVATLVGCNKRPTLQQVALRPLHHSLHCQLEGARAGGRWLHQATELPEHLRHLQVDFTKESIIALFLGNRPSGGYGIELQAQQAMVDAGRAFVPIVLQQPAPGMMQIQVITSPCLYFAIENGEYREIDVIDQHGETAWKLVSSTRKDEQQE